MSEVKTLNFFKFQLDKKTDVVALAALVLALAGGVFQLYIYLLGAQVILFPPEQILITCYNYNKTENYGLENSCHKDSYLRFSARMAYVNNGQIGYS